MFYYKMKTAYFVYSNLSVPLTNLTAFTKNMEVSLTFIIH